MSCGLPNARLHPVAERHQVAHLRVGQAGRALVGRAAPPPVEDPLRFGVDDEVVGVDGAGHHGVAEAGRGVEHGLPPPTGHRVGREQDARRFGVHHPLHDHGQRDPGAVDALRGAVGDRPVGPQRRPAAMHGVEHVVDAGDVEVGVLLSGEARAGQVLRGGRRSHRDATVGAGLQACVGIPHGVGHRLGERRIEHGRARGRGIRHGSRLDGRAPHRLPVRLGGDAEARRHVEAGADQLPEIRGLAADRRDVVGRQVREIDHEGAAVVGGGCTAGLDHLSSFGPGNSTAVNSGSRRADPAARRRPAPMSENPRDLRPGIRVTPSRGWSCELVAGLLRRQRVARLGRAPMERIVLGYDGSPAAVSALDWTAARAVPGQTSVDVVLVVSPLFEERATEWQRLGKAEALLLERVPGLDVAVHRLEGGVTDSIARASDDADLVVVGINPGHPIRAAAGGWMPLRLSTRSEAPVCMIPVGWRHTDDPVTVGVGSDGSSDAALDFAAAEALREFDRSPARALVADAVAGSRCVDRPRGHTRGGDRGQLAGAGRRRPAGADPASESPGAERTHQGQPIRSAAAIRWQIVADRHRHPPPRCADGQSARLGRAGDPLAGGVPDLRRAAPLRRARYFGGCPSGCSSWKIAACVRRSSPSLLSRDDT